MIKQLYKIKNALMDLKRASNIGVIIFLTALFAFQCYYMDNIKEHINTLMSGTGIMCTLVLISSISYILIQFIEFILIAKGYISVVYDKPLLQKITSNILITVRIIFATILIYTIYLMIQNSIKYRISPDFEKFKELLYIGFVYISTEIIAREILKTIKKKIIVSDYLIEK